MYIVRKAEKGDVEAVYALWRELSRDQMGKDYCYEGGLEFNFPGCRKQIEESVSSDDCGLFVACLETGEIMGFIEAWVICSDFMVNNPDAGYIVHYYVRESARGGAFDSFSMLHRLYRAAEKWLRDQGKKMVIADAFYHNDRIVKLLRLEKVYPYRVRMVEKI